MKIVITVLKVGLRTHTVTLSFRLEMAESGGESGWPLELGCSHRGGSVSACLLYYGVRVFCVVVWSVCTYTSQQNICMMYFLSSYCANGRLSPFL